MSPPDWLREQIESQSALELAVELHMFVTRAADAHHSWADMVVDVLRGRLEAWRPSLPGCEAFDNTARSLIEQALASYESQRPS